MTTQPRSRSALGAVASHAACILNNGDHTFEELEDSAVSKRERCIHCGYVITRAAASYWVIRNWNDRGWYAKSVCQISKPKTPIGGIVYGPYGDLSFANDLVRTIGEGWMKDSRTFTLIFWEDKPCQ